MQRAELAEVSETQRRQAEVLELEIRDRREAQARAVVINSPGVTFADGVRASSETGRLFRKVCIVENSSSGAISNVNVTFRTELITSAAALAYVVPAAERRIVTRLTEKTIPVERIDPGTAIRFLSIVRSEDLARSTTYEVTFTDAAGRKWRVDPPVQLQSSPTDPIGSQPGFRNPHLDPPPWHVLR